ncbi:MAG TPA: hypothetical protein PKA10_02305 [Selenomonadales bacterium]|nr:hypothetical protein [Selenomonadales bacterium]
MANTVDQQQQLDTLASVLAGMQEYLPRLAQGCESLAGTLHAMDKAEALVTLSQIVEGMSYCPKLIQSATALLGIKVAEPLCGNISPASYIGDLCLIFNNINEATQNEDYSMIADLTEYDLLPAVQTAQELFAEIQKRSMERIGD